MHAYVCVIVCVMCVCHVCVCVKVELQLDKHGLPTAKWLAENWMRGVGKETCGKEREGERQTKTMTERERGRL